MDEYGEIKSHLRVSTTNQSSRVVVIICLVTYYRRFIEGYSLIATHLIDLRKIEENIDPRIKLPNRFKPFEVYVDASNFTIGGLM